MKIRIGIRGFGAPSSGEQKVAVFEVDAVLLWDCIHKSYEGEIDFFETAVGDLEPDWPFLGGGAIYKLPAGYIPADVADILGSENVVRIDGIWRKKSGCL